MSVATTSRQAYDKLQDTLTDRETSVYEALQTLGQATNDDLSDFLHWPINQVTGRVTGLVSKGYVIVAGIGKSKLGNSAKIWTTTNSADKQIVMRFANDCAD